MKTTDQLSTRRQFLGTSAGALLAAGLWPGALAARAAETDPGGEFSFAVMNDTHYFDDKCAPFFEAAVKMLQKTDDNLAFCLVAGDLATDGKEHELQPFQEILGTMPCPVYAVPGNHDFDKESCKAYEKVYPRSRNHVLEHQGWTLLGLDTCDGPRWQDISIQQPTFAWLEEQIPKLNPQRPTIVFTHFPLGAGVEMRPKNADALLEMLLPLNVQAVFCGHFHGFTEQTWDGVSITTNRCMSNSRDNHDGTKEEGFFHCHAKDGRIQRTFVEFKYA